MVSCISLGPPVPLPDFFYAGNVNHCVYRQVLFYTLVTCLKNVMQIEHAKFLFKTVYFVEASRLTTSSHIVYGYTNS